TSNGITGEALDNKMMGMLNCLIFMTKATCFGLLNSTVFYLNLASSSCIVLVLVPKRRKTKNWFRAQILIF
ncbi:hypothetical protein ACJX0J_016192, partial [Zea mays]